MQTILYVNKYTVIFVFLFGTKAKAKQPNVLYQRRMVNGRGKWSNKTLAHDSFITEKVGPI